MNLLFFLIGATLVVVVALVAVGRVVARMAAQSRPAVYELPDAVDWIADRLPDEVTARVGYADVARILRWHLDWFAQAGLSSMHGEEIGGETAPDVGGVVVVLDLQVRYLEAIGALEADTDAGKYSA